MNTILVLLVVIIHPILCCNPYSYGCLYNWGDMGHPYLWPQYYPHSYPHNYYPEPEKAIDPIVCNFDSNDGCGYWTGSELVPFQWYHTYNNVAEKGLMIWKWTALNQSCVFGGRLVSKKFPSHGLPEGCLIIKWMVSGPDIREVRIFQRDSTNLYYPYDQCIYTQRDGLGQNQWIVKQIRLDTRGGDPMFYIEVLSNSASNTSFLAIDRIEYNYQNC